MLPNKKILENSKKQQQQKKTHTHKKNKTKKQKTEKEYLSAASGSTVSQSTNDLAEENNLQWCPDFSGSTLHKETPMQCWAMVSRQLS